MTKINWYQILATISVTSIITVLTGMFLFKWQQPKKQLTYEIQSPIPFEDNDEQTGIYHISFANEGTEVIEDINSIISFGKEDRIVKSIINANETLNYYEEKDSTKIELKVQNMNPNEKIGMSILATSNQNLPEKPKFSLRAKGINGIESAINNKPEKPPFDSLAILVALASALTSILYISLRKGLKLFGVKIKENPTLGTDPSQNGNLSFLCSIYGLESEVERYLNHRDESLVQYWSESDRLTMKALSNKDGDEFLNNVIEILKSISEFENMASDSKSIIYYNLSKLYGKTGEVSRSHEYIIKAKVLNEKQILRRIKLDPNRDLIKEDSSEQSA